MFDLTSLLSLLREISGLVAYVSNHSSFPQPLSAKSEKKNLELARQGDKQARDKLIEHNLRLVAHVAKKYQSTCLDQEDLIAIGTIGLIKAIDTYNQARGTQLATYVARCIENEILMAIRSSRKQRNEVLLQDPIGTDGEGNQISLLDILGSDPDALIDEVDARVQKDHLLRFLQQCLDERERSVLTRRYGLYGEVPRTQREIAKDMGISRSYVSRIEKKALLKLSRCFCEHQLI